MHRIVTGDELKRAEPQSYDEIQHVRGAGEQGRSASHLGFAVEVLAQPRKEMARWPSSAKKTTQRHASSSRARWRLPSRTCTAGREGVRSRMPLAERTVKELERRSPGILTG